MKILFTGSSGPKAAAKVATALSAEHTVRGVDLLPGANTRWLADITLIEDWAPYLDGCDAVVHFAALHAPHRESHSREAFHALNVHTTERLITAAKRVGVRRFLLASSTSVYGRAMRSPIKAVWVTENLTPEPEDIYDETKLAAEALCRDAFSPDFVTAALRFSRSFPEPLPEMTLYRLYRGIDARDVAQAFSLALTAALSSFESLNVSGASPFEEADCEALFTDAPAVLERRAPALVRAFQARGWVLPSSIDRVYVTDKASRVLGYRAQFGWESLLG